MSRSRSYRSKATIASSIALRCMSGGMSAAFIMILGCLETDAVLVAVEMLPSVAPSSSQVGLTEASFLPSDMVGAVGGRAALTEGVVFSAKDATSAFEATIS